MVTGSLEIDYIRGMRYFCAILAFSLCATIALAKQDCTNASAALPKLSTAKNVFPELHDFFKKYGSCLDGESAESSAAFITDVFAKNWEQLKSFNQLALKDRKFKNFILRSFEPNVTAQEKEVAQIINRSKKECPKGLSDLCDEIRKACEKSLESE